jgi:hypothetical protein
MEGTEEHSRTRETATGVSASETPMPDIEVAR